VYDQTSLAALVSDFRVERGLVYRRVDAATWVPVEVGEEVAWTTDAPGVAVLRLRHR
jgi:hypothetical protein